MEPVVTNSADTAKVELIAFEIGGQGFCIDIVSVREIRGWTPAAPLPQTPDYVLGVINLRGAVMPVLDVRLRLGLGATEQTSRHVIVVIQDGPRLAGLLVDAVQETFMVEASLFQAPPDLTIDTDAPFVDAILPLKDRMLSRLVVSSLMPAPDKLAA
ncbi:chemotaxis protein CheW [Caulobacter sp. NIBR1757]|uniref:chemotaxis protein CheW n=1 Tax=Caulobacter sp. NIBR1757 TaxID=3016000 RepID=UPI0022F03F36|nr:chemotaxis protein CheW [Caulobacter sp. NIBR1757]WGM40896.1 Chemotaxis protein CheW [Caulobacter sp. NIBR1757]